MNAHPYSMLFPVMTTAELRLLASDIKLYGQREPIITMDGEILDGRNRYAACEMVNVTPWLVAYQGDDALGFVVSHNLHRRHLTESQRGMIAARLATMKEGNPSGKNGHNGGTPPIGGVPPMSKTSRDEAAAALKVGTSTVDRARRIYKYGAPELITSIEAGSVTVTTATEILGLSKARQRELIIAGPHAVKEMSAKLRMNGGAATTEEPQPAPVPVPNPAPVATTRLPSYQPTDAPQIWQQARITLDRILPADIHRVSVLHEVIAYCQTRLTSKK